HSANEPPGRVSALPREPDRRAAQRSPLRPADEADPRARLRRARHPAGPGDAEAVDVVRAAERRGRPCWPGGRRQGEGGCPQKWTPPRTDHRSEEHTYEL